MTTSHSNYFFIVILSIAIILAILIFLPFLAPLVLAMALAVIFTPLHRKILSMFFKDNEKSSIGALVTLIIVAVIVFVPIFLIVLKSYSEIKDMYAVLATETQRSQVVDALNNASQSLSRALFGIYEPYSFDSINAVELLRTITHWAFSNLNDIFARVSKVVLEFFVMCIALFYFLRDGRELKRQLIKLSPLGDLDDEHILSKLLQAVRSIFAGSIAVGIIQGILTGIGFAIFGVPNPVLWGVFAAMAALIPGIGTSLILIPGIAYLFFFGSTGPAIGLLVWGFFAVGLIDNFLGPVLVNRGVKIHPFLILLSVLGGLVFFGPIGFVLGPLIIALLFALLELYKNPKSRVGK
ncbi:MAG: AI-2E family transporter [Candidatus Taylorbacteria bacterium]|nr:AI-2E family transporter [Candidatus Taylorbacteria bacterium]